MRFLLCAWGMKDSGAWQAITLMMGLLNGSHPRPERPRSNASSGRADSSHLSIGHGDD